MLGEPLLDYATASRRAVVANASEHTSVGRVVEPIVVWNPVMFQLEVFGVR